VVSEKKIKLVKDIGEEIEKYPVLGIIDMFKLPARQLHEIRNKLRGKAVIRMVKKRIIRIVLEKSGAKNINVLEDYIQGEPALIFTEIDPFRLARIIEESKSQAPAKKGDTAPKDIVVKAGPTSLTPGPVIGELQRIKIPAMVEGEKIAIKEDTIVAKEGEEISKELADVLSKLRIEPMEIALNLLAVWENGDIYPKDILFVPIEEYIERIKQAGLAALNLSININYFTPENISLLLSRAYQEALSLSSHANIITPETVGNLLAMANVQAQTLFKAAEK
jgi:large subunit ribosomal protein L10